MDLRAIFHFVSPQIHAAARKAAAQLDSLDVRHALAGGLAVGAHGYLRATKAIDFLVGEEAFEQHGGFVAFKPGVPIEVDGIRIDYLSPAGLGAQLETVLDNLPVSEGIGVVPLEALIYMKLVARRRQDVLDVVELVKAGADVKTVRGWLARHAPDYLSRFNELVEEASNSS
jgi:hypothetical protein